MKRNVENDAEERMSYTEMLKANEAKAERLEKKVARLEKELIAARLALAVARPCLLCGQTVEQGCKYDYQTNCDGTVQQ
jgi:hypothetical protein